MGIRQTGLSPIVKAVLRDIALFLAIVMLAGALVRYANVVDRFFIYFPERELIQTPADRGLEFEETFFTTGDGVRLHGWYVPGRSDVTLLWLHGNAGNISHRVDNLYEMHELLGTNIFIFDYRGYGRSEGSPSEDGTYLDGEAAMEFLSNRGDTGTKTVLFGRSLGGAVAVEIAVQRKIDALILESPFTSIQAMAKKHYPFLPGIGLLVRAKYDSISKIGMVDVPVMVVHGESDEIAPFEMGKELFEAANEPKRFYAIQGAGHNDTYLVGGQPYYDALARFLRDSLGEP